MKNFYECTFIINPGLDDAQIESTIKLAEDSMVRNGAMIVAVDRLGRRRLAYPITKKHNGFYVAFEFESEPTSIERIERYLTLDENVIRYLTLKLDKRELAAKRARAVVVAPEVIETAAEEAKPEPAVVADKA